MASVTINQELDSSFLKGLRLLHSSEPDAEEQLQQLWKQAVVDKYGAERIPTSILHKITVPSALKRENPDIVNDAAVETKRPKLENSLFSKPAASASPQPTTSTEVEVHHSSSNEDSDNESPLEILNVEGTCMKCKTSTSSTNNKLVECVDCHKHYHQLCHFPPITDMDLSDPRFVWYCSSCDQSITTTTSTNDKSKTASSTSTSAAAKSSSSSKGASVTTKSGRISSSTSSKSAAQGSASNTSGKSSESNSKEKSSSSSSTEKTGHMMKKRSMNKPDKKKSK